MSLQNLPAHPISIEEATFSVSRCTSATAQDLRALLLDENVPTPSLNKHGAQDIFPPKALQLSSRGARSYRTALNKKSALAELVSPMERTGELKPLEQVKLATQVVNITLRELTTVIKLHASRQTSRSGKTFGGTSCDSQRHQPVNLDRALQARCVNQLSQLPMNSPQARGNSPNTNTNQRCSAGELAVAECARIAFATLRKYHGQIGYFENMGSLKIEKGTSALISKLVALGMEDLAFKELEILSKRLCGVEAGHNTGEEPRKSLCQTRQSQSVPSREYMAELLCFRVLPTDVETISLIVATQLQILKLFSYVKRPVLTEAALKHLALATPYSPANLIAKTTVDQPLEQQGKSALQLHTLACSILTLCPSPSSARDRDATDRRKWASADCVFRYQLLTLQIQSMSWHLCSHKVDIQKDLMEPFHMFFRAFVRRSNLHPAAQFEVLTDAESVLSTLSHACVDPVHKDKGTDHVACVELFEHLADTAIESRQFLKGLFWLKRATSALQVKGLSRARLCSTLCKIAALHINVSADVADEASLFSALQDAAQSLRGDLHGESRELDAILMSTFNVRRTALSALLRAVKQDASDSPVIPLLIKEQMLELIIQTILFLGRYLGTRPTVATTDRKVGRYNERLHLVMRVWKSVLDSAVSLSKLPEAKDPDLWRLIDNGLKECVKLARSIETSSQDGYKLSAETPANHLPFVLISNAYWFHFLRQTEKDYSAKQHIASLQVSIDLISDRSPIEKRSGFLAVKMERLATTYESCGYWERALDVLSTSLSIQIDLGTLKDITMSASCRCLTMAFLHLQTAHVFGRNLDSFVRATRKACLGAEALHRDSFFDDIRLPVDQRGVLLEKQLDSLQRLLFEKELWESDITVLDCLAARLYEFYSEVQYPIRRLRVSASLLRASFTHPKIISRAWFKVIQDESKRTLPEFKADDRALTSLIPYLIARHDTYMTLLDLAPNMKSLDSAVDTWSDLVIQDREWETILERVDDVEEWVSQLELIGDYYHLQGEETKRILVLRLVITIYERQLIVPQESYISKLSALGLQLVRLGHAGEAAVTFPKAWDFIESHQISGLVVLRWHLAYAEFLLEIEKLPKCIEHTDHATRLMRVMGKETKQGYAASLLRSDYSYLTSRVFLAQAKLSQALFSGRTSVRLLSGAWALLNRCARDQNMNDSKYAIEDVDSLTYSTNGLSIPTDRITTSPSKARSPRSFRRVSFWPLVPSLFRQFAHLSEIYLHQGSFLETLHYAEKAVEIASTIRAPCREILAQTLISDYQLRGGMIVDGFARLKKAEALSSTSCEVITRVKLQAALGRAYGLTGDGGRQTHALQLAKELAHANCCSLSSRDQFASLFKSISTRIGNENLLSGASVQFRNHGNASSLKRYDERTIKVAKVEGPESKQCIDGNPDYLPLQRLKADIAQQQASGLLTQRELMLAKVVLSDFEGTVVTSCTTLNMSLTKAELSLRHGLEVLSTDPVYTVVPESTISCPSISSGRRQRSNESTRPVPKAVGPKPQGKNLSMKTTSNSIAVKRTSRSQHFYDFLLTALHELHIRCTNAQKLLSTAMIHRFAETLSRTLMLVSSTSALSPDNRVSSTSVLYAMELGRNIATLRERSSIEAERWLRTKPDFGLWSGTVDSSGLDEEIIVDPDLSAFQSNYIDIIPATWTVISVSLSGTREELRVSKLRRGQSPFLLDIPLARQSCSASIDKEVTFDKIKEELSEVVGLASSSTRCAIDMNRKGAKSQWWKARQDLDTRLKSLVVIIEKVWLGGFKGIFSQMVPPQDLLLRFQQSFCIVMDKHLPSRQKSCRGNTIGPLLDLGVLELFIGLGDPRYYPEVEEALMDLLYFVVDIFQFNGERNAYDEIDFDTMAIETLHALIDFHEAHCQDADKQAYCHTILILDKALHCFPWESLPYLQGQAVSRVPSLCFLRTRILQQQAQPSGFHQAHSSGVTVSAREGACILNPAGDLVSTQRTFQDRFKSMSAWSTVVNRAPTETEIIDFLSKRNVYLYFGHGSGGQYVRARLIKELDRCAVALLMGCSSGTMTEAGEFESYGVPMTYLYAGAPAVVGTLWDVTDKDIDRFTMMTLQSWGLFTEPSDERRSPWKKGLPDKSRVTRGMRVAEAIADDLGSKPVALDQAVGQGRNACVLRYLNGAAPVVYGTPVFLS